MGCGCGGSRGNVQADVEVQYIFTNPDTGRQETYRTSYEAEYANMRVGGRGNIRTEPKA